MFSFLSSNVLKYHETAKQSDGTVCERRKETNKPLLRIATELVPAGVCTDLWPQLGLALPTLEVFFTQVKALLLVPLARIFKT